MQTYITPNGSRRARPLSPVNSYVYTVPIYVYAALLRAYIVWGRRSYLNETKSKKNNSKTLGRNCVVLSRSLVQFAIPTLNSRQTTGWLWYYITYDRKKKEKLIINKIKKPYTAHYYYFTIFYFGCVSL